MVEKSVQIRELGIRLATVGDSGSSWVVREVPISTGRTTHTRAAGYFRHERWSVDRCWCWCCVDIGDCGSRAGGWGREQVSGRSDLVVEVSEEQRLSERYMLGEGGGGRNDVLSNVSEYILDLGEPPREWGGRGRRSLEGHHNGWCEVISLPTSIILYPPESFALSPTAFYTLPPHFHYSPTSICRRT